MSLKIFKWVIFATLLLECQNLKLTSDNKEVPESGVNYETVYQGFQNISPDLKSAEYEVERAAA